MNSHSFNSGSKKYDEVEQQAKTELNSLQLGFN